MNEHQMEGSVGNMAGRVQSAAGALSDDPVAEIKGKVRETAGKLQGAYGDAVDTVSDVGGSVTRAIQANPVAAVLIAGTIGCVLAWTLSRD
jgi:uncharacterized protein YjbJ (UPF0337 family)